MTNKAGSALTVLPIMAVLLIAAFTAPSLGMVGFAAAKKMQNIDTQEDTNPEPMFASLTDLDIKSYGFDKKNAYIEVYGSAGGTKAEHEEGEEGFGHAIAYVLVVETKRGVETWAIDSHEAQHGTSGDSSTMWHAHRVVLGDSTKTPNTVEGSDCLNEVDHVTHAMTDGNRMIFEDMKVMSNKGELESVKAKAILGAQTVLLEVQVADPDNPGDAPCVAKVVHVFDSAEIGRVKN